MPPKRRTGGGNPTTTPEPDLSGGPIESQVQRAEPTTPPDSPSGVSSASDEPVDDAAPLTDDADRAEADDRWARQVKLTDAVKRITDQYGPALNILEALDGEPGVVQRRLSALAVPQPGAIFQAMWDVMNDVQGVGKRGQMDPSSKLGNYKYRRYDDLKLALSAACRAHGVMLQSRVISVVNERHGNMTRVQVHIEYLFTSLADGTTVRFESLGEAFDRGDKATSKAMTMALKTCLDQALMLAAEDIEDPDASRPEPDDPPRSQQTYTGTEGRVYREGDPVPPGGHRVGDRREVGGTTFVKHGDGPAYPNNAPRDESNPWDQGPPPQDTRTDEEKAQAAADKLGKQGLTMAEWTAISNAAQGMGLMEHLIRTPHGDQMALKHWMVAVGRTL